MEPGGKLLSSTARGEKFLENGHQLVRGCGDELHGSGSRGYSCAGAAQSTTQIFDTAKKKKRRRHTMKNWTAE